MSFIGSLFSFIERVTKAHPVIDINHANIHKGQAFTIANKIDVTAGAVAGFQITVPASGYVHFKAAAFSVTGGPVYISLLEDYTFVGGSAIPAANRRRVGTPPTAATVVKGAASITAVAGSAPVSLDMIVLPGTSTAAKLGSSSQAAEEWVLKPGTNYLIAITNATSPGATITVGYELFWYEEDAA